jgi:heme/copper-type cytochrome/quinol oxidase subunit 3
VTLDPWSLPLLNTVILLSSGVTITCAHRAIIAGERTVVINGLFATVFYGVVFTLVQGYEYNAANFSINDSVFGSIFFILTGFHGFHVIVGTIFLVVCLYRQINYHFTRQQHVGFECAAWY